MDSLRRQWEQDLEAWAAKGLLRRPPTVQAVSGSRVRVVGRDLVNFSSNDYLGMASDPRLVASAGDVGRSFGWGTGSSRLLAGNTTWHEALEREIAVFRRAESVRIFGSGYLANVGMVASLVGEEDLILSDRLNHASLIDACRLTRAKVFRYEHVVPEAVEAAIREERRPGQRVFVLTDGVFSMDGDIAPLADLWDVCRRRDAHLLVDDAHGNGVLGATGRGVLEYAGLESEEIPVSATLSKAFGSFGGFVAGPAPMAEYLWNRARTLLYSTALPAAICAASAEALRIVAAEPERRERLRSRIALCDRLLREAGLRQGPAVSQVPILPVVVGDATRASEIARKLFEKGYYLLSIRPPTVPEGTSRLRISISAAHTEEEIEGLVQALREAWAPPRRG